MHQNYNFELQGQIQGQGQGGQGPEFNNFYSRQRQNLPEIFNDTAANCGFDLEGQGQGQGGQGQGGQGPKFNHFYSRQR